MRDNLSAEVTGPADQPCDYLLAICADLGIDFEEDW